MKNKRYYAKCILVFVFVTVFTSMCFVSLPAYAAGEDETYAQDKSIEEKIMEEQIEADEVDLLEKELKKYKDEKIDEILPGYDPEKIIRDVAKGKLNFNLPDIINKILTYLFEEIYLNMGILVKLMVLVALCAILNNLQSSF